MTDVVEDDDVFVFETDDSVDDFDCRLSVFVIALDTDGRSELLVDAVEFIVFDANVDVPDEYGSVFTSIDLPSQ